MASANRFKTFADPEDVAASAASQASEAKKSAAPKEGKKIVVRQKVEPNSNRQDQQPGDDEFVSSDKRTQTAGRGDRRGRGDRGGRGRGDRGGRGRGGQDGEVRGRGRGERGARGRGGRGGQDGDGKPHRYEGKPREEAHPMDKKSGTGRGRRDQAKDGHGRGNWGTDKGAAEEGRDQVVKDTQDRVDEEKKDDTQKVEDKEPEEVIEVQEVGITLDDYLAQKQAAGTGLASYTKEARAHEKQSTKGIEVSNAEKKRINTIDSNLKKGDTYAVVRNEGQDLMGFSSKDDDDFSGSRGGAAGGRGDRERREREPRQPRGGRGRGGRGGRNQGKIEIDDESFPAL